MRKFITKKKIKIARYKLIGIGLITLIIFIVIINLGVNLLFKYSDSNKFLSVFMSNALGNNLESYNLNNNRTLFFFKNSFGYNLDNNTRRNIKEYVGSDLVYIFNTFQTDKYKSNKEEDYNVDSVVVQASLILEEYLKEYGIRCMIDLDNREIGYEGVRKVISKKIKNYKNIKYIFDLGISTDKDMTQEIDKVKYAKVQFKVSKDSDYYETNLKMANEIEKRMETYNLSKGVLIVKQNINQDLKENMITIEVGNGDNTIEEVSETLKILAGVINDYIKDDK